MNSEIGWVFIYIFGFGISDFIVRKYIKKDIFYVIYYLLMGIIGFYILKRKQIISFLYSLYSSKNDDLYLI